MRLRVNIERLGKENTDEGSKGHDMIWDMFMRSCNRGFDYDKVTGLRDDRKCIDDVVDHITTDGRTITHIGRNPISIMIHCPHLDAVDLLWGEMPPDVVLHNDKFNLSFTMNKDEYNLCRRQIIGKGE